MYDTHFWILITSAQVIGIIIGRTISEYLARRFKK